MFAGAASLAPSLAQAGSSDPAQDAQLPLVNPEKPMPETVTAEEIRALLKLEPNKTCGFVRETYKSDLAIAPGGLPAPFAAGRHGALFHGDAGSAGEAAPDR
jgi:hypothetical protein